MPCELLIHAVAHRKAVKGAIQTIKDSLVVDPSPPPGKQPPSPPRLWGKKEGLPDYIILKITDKTAAQVSAYRENMMEVFQFELVASNASGRRYRIWVNPKIGAMDTSRGMRAKFRDWLINNYGAVLVTYNAPNEAVFDIPNTDWQALLSKVHDKFTRAINGHRWYFSEADVDAAVAGGGTATVTGAQAASRIVDRLA